MFLTNEQKTFPRVAEFIEKQMPEVAKDSRLVRTLKNSGHFPSERDVRDALESPKSAPVKIVELGALLNKPNHSNVCGNTPGGYKIMTINRALAKRYEAYFRLMRFVEHTTSEERNEAGLPTVADEVRKHFATVERLLRVTLLHELVHFGNNQAEFAEVVEEGHAWERKIFGKEGVACQVPDLTRNELLLMEFVARRAHQRSMRAG